MTRLRLLHLLFLFAVLSLPSAHAASISGGGLPGVGSEGDCLLTSSGQWLAGACPGAGTGAPTTAQYWTATADATLSAERNLGLLTTGLVFNTVTAGVGVPSTYAGTSCTNQVVRLLSASGVATCVTLTSAYVDTSIWTGTVSSGVLKASSQGILAQAIGGTDYTISVSGTTNQVDLSGAGGDRVVALSSTLTIPGPGIEFTETAGDLTCAAGNYWIKANSTTSNFRKCQNGTASDLDTGGAGGIGGSTGATDNAIIRADGVGGSTIQSASGCTISDTNVLTCSGGFVGSGGSTGTLTLLEGTAPGAGANAGEHNIYFDSADSKLKSHENAGVAVIYTRTADDLSVFSATSSAQLAGVLSDEIGTSGGFVRGTGSTLTDLTVAGTAIVFPDGVTQIFNPNGTAAGVNVGSHTADPSVPNNGDIIYNSTSNTFRCRENGSWKDCINSAAGSGDVTDVNAGAGIAVATPGGPQPTVSLDLATLVNSQTIWDGANATRTLTAAVTGTDPVISFSASSVDVTTGTLKQGGVSVSTASSTDTFTNKTLDAEGTGNVITIPRRIWLPAAGCNNATAGSIWDLPTSAPAVAACVTGTNTQKGVLDFADGSNLSAQISWKLPSTWTGNIDANIKWFTTAITGDVVWQIATICVADAETDDPAFNTASTVTDTAKGTTNQTNDAAITSVTVTGCAAGELMHVKIFRDSGNVSDTLAATARLIGVELVVREAL